MIQYRHPDKRYLSVTKSTFHKSIHAFIFQMLRKISFFHQHATLRMYTGDFKELAAVCVLLLNRLN